METPSNPPPPPDGPQAPAGPPTAPPGPEGAPSYGGPVPPGGWHQPIAQPQPGWYGSPLASWGSRFAAWIIDGLILLVPVIVLSIVVVAVATGSDTAGWVSGVLAFFTYLIVLFLYSPLLMMRAGEHNGQTLGKQALGIRVVRDNGDSMGFGWAALREIVVKGFLVAFASSVIPFLPWLLDNLWPLWDGENRAVHDMIVSTHVVQA